MITHLIFDLDNTLYPSSAAIDKGITSRMMQFVADFLGVSDECAMQKRLTGLKTYGTTLEWLRHECGLTDEHIERYFAFVHPECEADEVPFDPNLRALLTALPFTKTVLTNAPREHATRILEKLNVADLFTAVVDLRANALRGKPHESAYRRALGSFSVQESLFIDDHVKYIVGYEKIGGRAVLVDERDVHGEYKNRIRSVYELPRFLGL